MHLKLVVLRYIRQGLLVELFGLNIHKDALNWDPLILNIHLTRYNGWGISNKYANNW